jgi:hypothetical protein
MQAKRGGLQFRRDEDHFRPWLDQADDLIIASIDHANLECPATGIRRPHQINSFR